MPDLSRTFFLHQILKNVNLIYIVARGTGIRSNHPIPNDAYRGGSTPRQRGTLGSGKILKRGEVSYDD